MRARLAVLLVLAATPVLAAPKPPCASCTLDLPAKHEDAVPLVVVLHGDRESASAAGRRWRAAVVERGWALLSLQCPTDQGCKDSWWKWDGEPSWVIDQVAKVGKLVTIDPARVYLVGWSGGASWIGWRAQDWGNVFAAIVIHGGGIPPREEACPAKPLPAYFLVGDKNPLHRNMIALHSWWKDCKQEEMWDLVKGGDHEREDAALDKKKALRILDWLEHAHGS